MTMLNKTKLREKNNDDLQDISEEQEINRPNIIQKAKNKLFRKAHFKNSVCKNKNLHKTKVNSYINKLGRSNSIDTQPSTPHNTTQYIVDSSYQQNDANIYGYNMDPVEYNFSHHAMAGSMMSLMQEKINNEELKAQKSSSNSSISSNGWNLSENGTEEINYDKYLEEIGKVEDEESLEGIIRGLVDVIKRKDSELISLLSDPRRKDTM